METIKLPSAWEIVNGNGLERVEAWARALLRGCAELRDLQAAVRQRGVEVVPGEGDAVLQFSHGRQSLGLAPALAAVAGNTTSPRAA